MATQTGSERVKEEDPQRQTTEKELATVRSPESLHSSSNDSGIPARGTNPTKECASLVSRVCEVITRVYNTEEYIFTYGRSQHLCVCMYVYVCKYNENIASNKSYRSKRKQKKNRSMPPVKTSQQITSSIVFSLVHATAALEKSLLIEVYGGGRRIS